MSAGSILVRLNPGPATPDPAFDETLGLDDLAELKRQPVRLLGRILRRKPINGIAVDLRAVPKPFLVGAMLRALSRGPVQLRDRDGRELRLGWPQVISAARAFLADKRGFRALLAQAECDIKELEAHRPSALRSVCGPVLSLKPDLWLGSQVGGAVAHASGIANALAKKGFAPVFAAFESNPAIDAAIPQHIIEPPTCFWNVSEAPLIAANQSVMHAWPEILSSHRPGCVYMRLSAFHYAGALLAVRSSLPLLVEYNGSEPWIARNWGRAFANEALALRAENAVLRAADRIAVVSEPLRQDLIERGLAADRIIVQPNAVDCEQFNPDIDATDLRAHLAPGADCVFGFIGSFGLWHGVPVLVEAFVELCRNAGANSTTCRLVVIGDGTGAKELREAARRSGHGDTIIFTGVIPQKDAPRHLAACDVLVAPHVRNADGSAFFGSPTKLFEYMASGRAIIASRLGQMADILVDGETALLVPPGDTAALTTAMVRLADNPDLRHELGAAARARAISAHGWEDAVRRIFC